jgi:peptidoglycan LD-endopeptidase CwlK
MAGAEVVSYAFGTRSRQRLAGVHPDMVRLAERAIAITTQDFGIVEGRRTLDRQRELVASGASQTLNSRHLTGHAIDVAPWLGEFRWDHGLFYPIIEAFRQAAIEFDTPLRWGGSWGRIGIHGLPLDQKVAAYVALRRSQGRKAFIDMPHLELPADRYPA